MLFMLSPVDRLSNPREAESVEGTQLGMGGGLRCSDVSGERGRSDVSGERGRSDVSGEQGRSVGEVRGGVRIRPADGDDLAAIVAFIEGLSVRTRYLRFFSGAIPSQAVLRLLAGGNRADVLLAVCAD